MAVTVEQIRTAESDEALFNLLSDELQLLLPEELQNDPDRYHATLAELPRGIRAMAGMYFFDVSMSLDDLAWHFGNQNDERDLQETLNGLREMELIEIAEMFEQMWEFMKPHMTALQAGDYGGKDFSDWLGEIGAQKLADPMNKIIWKYCEEHSDFRLMASWLAYARKYPDRCVIAEPHS